MFLWSVDAPAGSILLLVAVTQGGLSLTAAFLGIAFALHAAAVLTGAGYGLLYPVIQTWAVNVSPEQDRHAALTWFVVSYFIGIFGFPAIGGWLLVTAGKAAFVCVLVALATLELAAATVRVPLAVRRPAPPSA